MATKPDFFNGGADPAAIVDGRDLFGMPSVKLNAPRPQARIRTLRTVVSDTDLEAADFMVASSPASNVIDRPDSSRREFAKLSSGIDFLHDGWLVHRPANHVTPPPSWLGDFERRLEELREAAVEEAVPFSEESAATARAFCEHHGRSIRPSVFLVGNGNVRLVWENDEDEQIGLQFRADRARVQCILFKRRHDGISAITVMETNGGVMDLLTGNRLLHLLGKK